LSARTGFHFNSSTGLHVDSCTARVFACVAALVLQLVAVSGKLDKQFDVATPMHSFRLLTIIAQAKS
jgi:hypothetical protein